MAKSVSLTPLVSNFRNFQISGSTISRTPTAVPSSLTGRTSQPLPAAWQHHSRHQYQALMSAAATGYLVDGAICDAAVPHTAADVHVQCWPPALARCMLWRQFQDASMVLCTRCIGSHVLRFMAAPGDGLETECSARRSQMSTRAEHARSERDLWPICDRLSAWSAVVSKYPVGLRCEHDLPAVLQKRRQIDMRFVVCVLT